MDLSIKSAKEKFKDHELKELVNTEEVKVFVFRNPNSSTYWQQWTITGGVLTVIGDCHDSIYRWSNNLTLKSLANYDLQYFSGKCTADYNGSNQSIFDANEASKKLKDCAVDKIFEDYEDEIDLESSDWQEMDLDAKFKVTVPIMATELDLDEDEVEELFYLDNEADAWNFIRDETYECLFGYDFSDSLQSMTGTPYLHLAALKVAYEKYPDAF